MSAADFPEFHDVRLERGFDYGSAGGPEWRTDIQTARSGREQRNLEWAQHQGSWQTGARNVGQADVDYIYAFFHARAGQAYAFRYKNWADFEAADELFHTGDGVTRELQIIKTYGDAAASYMQSVQLPIASAFSMTRTLPGGAAEPFSNYSLDAIGGVLTLEPAAEIADANDISVASVDNSFNASATNLSIFEAGTAIRTTGFGKSANNGLFIVATSAANKITVTNAAGTAPGLADETAGALVSLEDEPNVPDALYAWSGEFDLPVRFVEPSFEAQFEAYGQTPRDSIFALSSLRVKQVVLA